ncbi:VWA domain-containing protein [Streptomyces sp. SID3343]|uniref:VWA domain-containing protein n=1 Tax=Streptomyces sp. SID3343 TaxID=2690260 RepID=UPI00136842BE|nr:VWA domain-containing protein [Streptomyces sp. SID3343]MYW00699.1 stress response protein [Streptomyces sp. SID3343]
MTTLIAGANVPVPAGPLTLVIRRSANAPTADASALLLGSDGKVRFDEDFVFYNQPAAADGAVRHIGPTAGGEAVTVDPDALPGDVERVVVAASVHEGTFAAVPGLSLALLDGAGVTAATFAVPAGGSETVMVLGELYRRQGGWKLRAIGQGYDTGLAGLAGDYGVDVADDAADTPPAGTLPVVPVGATPGWEPPPYSDEPTMRLPAPADDPQLAGLPPEVGARVSLRKEAVRITLEKKGLTGVRARVALVLDRSGSMRQLYAGGAVGRLVERMAPIAAKLDDDGELDAWIFADEYAALDTVRIPELPQWIANNVYIDGRNKRPQAPPLPDGSQRVPDLLSGVYGGNNEPAVIEDILRRYRGEPGAPVLVLFYSDGGVNRSKQIQRLLTEAAGLPIFWQFVGLGRSDYGILERIDTMPGRLVDNAGFFQVDDIDRISDVELYERILSEFPQWLTAARTAGVVR